MIDIYTIIHIYISRVCNSDSISSEKVQILLQTYWQNNKSLDEEGVTYVLFKRQSIWQTFSSLLLLPFSFFNTPSIPGTFLYVYTHTCMYMCVVLVYIVWFIVAWFSCYCLSLLFVWSLVLHAWIIPFLNFAVLIVSMQTIGYIMWGLNCILYAGRSSNSKMNCLGLILELRILENC